MTSFHLFVIKEWPSKSQKILLSTVRSKSWDLTTTTNTNTILLSFSTFFSQKKSFTLYLEHNIILYNSWIYLNIAIYFNVSLLSYNFQGPKKAVIKIILYLLLYILLTTQKTSNIFNIQIKSQVQNLLSLICNHKG